MSRTKKTVNPDVVRQLEHTVQQLKRKLAEKDSTTNTDVINGFWSLIQEKDDALIAKNDEITLLKRTIEQQHVQLMTLNEQVKRQSVLCEESKQNDNTIAVLRATIEKLQRKCNARSDYDLLRYERDRLSEVVEKLTVDNNRLTTSCEELDTTNRDLSMDVAYLRNKLNTIVDRYNAAVSTLNSYEHDIDEYNNLFRKIYHNTLTLSFMLNKDEVKRAQAIRKHINKACRSPSLRDVLSETV